jgi:hypothetical protein
MVDPLHADSSVELVRDAVRATNKKHVADEAGLSDAILNKLFDPDFSPHLRTQRKLERAAIRILTDKASHSNNSQRETAPPVSHAAVAEGTPITDPEKASA